jgi:N6-adenosine-specific RNA methylase IME4
MKTKDIQMLPVDKIADNNCWLFLWTTNNYLIDGLNVIKSWGFRYVTNFVWTKERFGIGYYFRGQHELCLFGVKGNLKPKRRNVSSVLFGPTTRHSEKPQLARKKIEEMSHEPRIELFAREKVDGWDCWGNEV